MAMSIPDLSKERRQKPFAIAILVVCSLIFVIRGYHDQRLTQQSLDFKTVYGSAKCLLHNCDPYDSTQIFAEYEAAGGPIDDLRAFRPHEAVYSPSALSLLTPFALLSWGPAHLLWLVLSTGIFLLGAACMADLCMEFAAIIPALFIGIFLLTSTTLIMLAQPAQLTIGLCSIAAWCLLREKHMIVGIIFFALSLVLKPHVTGLVWLFFLLRNGRSRRRALQIMGVTLLISLPGMVWASVMPASSHWTSELPANVAALATHGRVNDPGPRNGEATNLAGLPSLLSLYRDQPSFYNKAAIAAGLALIAAWAVPMFRMPSSIERDYLGLASIVCVSLLPVYHREYDTRILLLIFPAFALLMKKRGFARLATVAVTLCTMILITHNWNNLVIKYITPRLIAKQGALTTWQTIVWLRPIPVFTSFLTLYYLGWLYSAWLRTGMKPSIKSAAPDGPELF